MIFALNPRRLVQPVHEPLSLLEVKLFLRIEHDAEDALLANVLRAAREAAEHLLNLSCITQTWQYQVAGNHCGKVALPCGPVISVTQLETREREDSDWSPVPTGNYSLRDNTLSMVASAPAYPDMRITYTAGFATAEEVPASIRHALLRHVAVLYESRASAAVIEVGHIYAGLREVRV